MRIATRLIAAAALLATAAVTSVTATPVASNSTEVGLLGRVIPEPLKSADYLQLDPAAGTKELDTAFGLLQKMYPRYLTYTTVAKQLHDPRAVSAGGRQLPVITVTDKTVPDSSKEYVLLTFAHSAEPCGREGVLRSAEDLAIAATKAPTTTYDDGTIGKVTHRFTVPALLKKLKIFIVGIGQDGWAAGDAGNGLAYSQYTANGINSNRVAYQTGWVFSTPLLRSHAYTTATQPEGISITRYLQQVRAKELHGRPFAVASDIHGPLPTGAILIHDVGDNPAKRLRTAQLAARVQQRMNGVFESYMTHQGASAYATAASTAESVRSMLSRYNVPPGGLGTAGVYPLQWATYSGIWDLLNYTVSSTWGQFSGDDNVGIGADAISYEINCITSSPWDPALMQLFVDNVRAIVQTSLVHAAALPGLERQPPVVTNLRGRVGFYDNGSRVTSRNGAGAGVPKGYPGVALWRQLVQKPYDVSQTDVFRELQRQHLVSGRLTAVSARSLPSSLAHLDTLVIADQMPPPSTYSRLAAWVRGGGNLVATDRALQLLPKIGLGSQSKPLTVSHRNGYVGYADFDHSDPWLAGLPTHARQTYDPVGLGYPLLMNRDAYWNCADNSTTCPSGTVNSAPIWMLPTAFVAGIKGARVVGTVDPPATPSSTSEGTGTSTTDVGVVPLGRGRIAYFGALLPTPTEAYPHFFGLFGNTLSFTAQSILLRAMTWARPRA
jgi:hypothetical protein